LKYSFQDIEEMRRMTADMICCERGFRSPESLNQETIEARLRTYLANGITPSDMKPHYEAMINRVNGKLDRVISARN
jgi:hypothetical protein